MSTRQVRTMLREMATQDEVVVVGRHSVARLARMTLVAEQFGFQYVDAVMSGGQQPKTALLLHRDESMEARQRAAAVMAQYPQAGNGGDLPGMQPGGKLKPLPEALPHLELVKARINFDLTGRNANKRILGGALGITGALVISLVRGAFEGGSLVTAVVIYGLLMALLGAGFWWTKRRNAKYEVRLQEAGLRQVRDESGRVRYLPPGGELPGHGNPFVPQAPAPPQVQPQPQAYAQPQPQPQQGQWPGQPVPQQPQGQPQPQQAAPAAHAFPAQPAQPGPRGPGQQTAQAAPPGQFGPAPGYPGSQ